MIFHLKINKIVYECLTVCNIKILLCCCCNGNIKFANFPSNFEMIIWYDINSVLINHVNNNLTGSWLITINIQ